VVATAVDGRVKGVSQPAAGYRDIGIVIVVAACGEFRLLHEKQWDVNPMQGI
jgi:hypothetical protein